MTSIWSDLSTPVSIAGMDLQSRYLMAPMTRGQSPGGVPTDAVAEYYERRADTVGLIVTEGVYVDHPSAGGSEQIPRLDSPDALRGWKHVVESVHGQGAKIFSQLWHIGGIRRAGAPPFPEAPVFTPSGRALSGREVGEEPSAGEIDAVIEAFARAAEDSKAVGFDGVELHGAHGYLLDQFLWGPTNSRTDRYGGSLRNRVQLSVEVISAIRDRVGADYPIQFRFSQWKAGRWDARIAENPAELAVILEPLTEAGVDIFHPSTRRFWQPAFEGSTLTLSGWTKRMTGKPTVLVGHVGVDTAFRADGPDANDPSEQEKVELLTQLFASEQFDLLGIGRAILADPKWIEKTVAGRPETIVPYTKDSEAVYF